MNKNKAIKIYGDRAEIDELAGRLVAAMPGSRRLTDEQGFTLAQICHVHGLDPFNGEAWYIPGSGVMVGIKGLRKAARRQLKAESGDRANFWTQFSVDTMVEKYGCENGDIIYICQLRDSESLAAWTEAIERMHKIPLPIDLAVEAAGRPPVVTGIGIVKKNERSKMPLNQLAMKRAEAHALKQRFDIQFTTEYDEQPYVENWPSPEQLQEFIEEAGSQSTDQNDDVVDADYSVAPQSAEDAAGAEPSGERPYSPERLKARISELAERNEDKPTEHIWRQVIASQLNHVFGDTSGTSRHDFLEWLTGKQSTSRLSNGQVYAIIKWLGVKFFDEEPNKFANVEANAAFNAIRAAEGQTNMFDETE